MAFKRRNVIAEYKQAEREFYDSDEGKAEINRIFLKVYYNLQSDKQILFNLKTR